VQGQKSPQKSGATIPLSVRSSEEFAQQNDRLSIFSFYSKGEFFFFQYLGTFVNKYSFSHCSAFSLSES
jgi:hypothetical protein